MKFKIGDKVKFSEKAKAQHFHTCHSCGQINPKKLIATVESVAVRNVVKVKFPNLKSLHMYHEDFLELA